MRTLPVVPSSIGRALACLSLFALSGTALLAKKPLPPSDPFTPYVELAPFKVNGKQLSISIHARSSGDRRYAEGFAEEVVKVVCESVTPETGKGLVIIGKKGEPHPAIVFQQFLALAKDGKLDPAVAARASELKLSLDLWQEAVNEGQGEAHKGDAPEDVDLEFEKIMQALPLPLEGIGSKLYVLAWREKFDDAKVDAAMRALKPADLEGNQFGRFDWVFYLPPKNAFDQVLDGIVAEALKEDGAGFMERMAVKGVMVVVKPQIRKAIEAVRQGLLFMTVVDARTHYDKAALSELTGAYIEVLMPDWDDEKQKKTMSGSEHERAVSAVRACIAELGKEPKSVADAMRSEPGATGGSPGESPR